jgi:hypothetical protein
MSKEQACPSPLFKSAVEAIGNVRASPLFSSHPLLYLKPSAGGAAMKIPEDWLSVIIAFGLMILAMIGLIGPGWMKF